jgi:hypothetical protein
VSKVWASEKASAARVEKKEKKAEVTTAATAAAEVSCVAGHGSPEWHECK